MFSKNNKKFIFFLLIFLFIGSFAIANDIVIPELTDEQILSAKNNGMIKAMCFVLELLTGKFARAIFALFVVYIGWTFMVGKVKDYKPIFIFVVAIAVTIGSTNIANVLTGTTYSCKYFEELIEKDENTLYNQGQCIVSEINGYDLGQEWLLCGNSKNYNISNCKEVVTNESDIKYGGSNETVVLNKCQEGYFKEDNNKYLFYSCVSALNNGIYSFKLTSPLDQTSIDKATCKKACKLSDLEKITKQYNIDFNSLVDVAGTSRKVGNYYTQGYKFTANCENNYLEYGEVKNDSGIEYVENTDGIVITCSENGTFTVSGSCKSRCDLSKTSLSKNVSTWNKCDENGCSKTSGAIFNYGDVLEINSCVDGYFLSSINNTNTRIKCSDNGSWVLANETTGNSCIKKCKVSDIDVYSNVEKFSRYCDNDITGSCDSKMEITGETLLEQNQSVKIDSCIANTDFDFIDNKNGVYTCNANGDWELTEGTSGCYAGCNYSDVEYIYKNISFFNLVDKKGEILEGQRTINASQLQTIQNGQRLMISNCFDGFSINKNKKQLIITCSKGKLSYKNTSNYCSSNCVVNDLFTSFDKSNLAWEEIDSKGNIVNSSEILNQNTGIINVYNGSFYQLASCADGYSIPYGKPLIVQCLNGKWNLYRNYDNYCVKSCDNSLLASATNILSNVKNLTLSESDGKKIEGSKIIDFSNLTGQTDAGEYITINECNDGFGLSDNKAPVFKCFNGSWTITKNNNYTCYNKCSREELLKAFGNANFETVYESKSNGTIIGDVDIVNSNDNLIDLDTYYVISTCKDGYKLLNNKSRILKCTKGKIEIYSNMDNICTPIQ